MTIDTAKLRAEMLRALDEIERLLDAFEAAPDAVHYAHESTARLARAALSEGDDA